MACDSPSGVRKLFTLCIDVLIEHIDVIEEVGAIPFDVLRPVLEKCSAQQLKRLEFYNQVCLYVCLVVYLAVCLLIYLFT